MTARTGPPGGDPRPAGREGREPVVPRRRTSALDRMIDRMTAQRAALEWAAGCVAGGPVTVMEVGLGKGWTYDHLRSLFPPRDILVFDMWLRAPDGLRPDEDRLFLGDFRETLPAAATRFQGVVRLAHADIGSARAEDEDGIRRWIGGLLVPFLASGALVLSDRPIGAGREGWVELEVPGTGAWAYHGWRVTLPISPGSFRCDGGGGEE